MVNLTKQHSMVKRSTPRAGFARVTLRNATDRRIDYTKAVA